MVVIVPNKVILLLLLIFSANSHAGLKLCADETIINAFIQSKDTSALVNCAKNTKSSNLGFKASTKTVFLLEKELDKKVFYFSFPMLHEIDFFHYRSGKLIAQKSYSKVHNKGNEYVYFDNTSSEQNQLIALINTKNSVQLPYKLFNSTSEFDTYLKKKHIFDGLWFGIIFLTLLLTVGFFYIRRKSEITFYFMHICALFVIQMAFSGYFFSNFNFLPEYFKHRIVVFACSVLTFGTVSLIYKTFIVQLKNNKIINIYRYVAFLAIAHLVYSIFSYGQLTIQLTSLLTLILALSSILVCIYAMTKRLKYSTSFLFSFSLFLFSSLVFTLKDIGILDINEIQANYLVKLSLLVEVFIIGTVLIRALFQESKFLTNAKVNELIATSNVQIMNKLQHDIQSPLSYLESSFGENGISDNANLRAITRVKNIIMGLKSENGTSEILEPSQKASVSINSFIENLINDKKTEYSGFTGLKLEFQSQLNGQEQLSVNKLELGRALSNIINNSIEARHEHDDLCVQLTVKIVSKAIQITIQDNGIGIPKKKLSSIFDYGQSFNKETGTGIGLFQAKQFSESENGTIKVESELNLGTTFIISLPMTIKSQVVLIDNDEFTHLNWKRFYKKTNTELLSFRTIDEFLNASSNLSKLIPIFLDSKLDNEIKGEIDGHKIANKGYRSISITTGHPSAMINIPDWVQSVISKCPPLESKT